MHDDVRDRFLKDGFLFPVKFLTADESKFYGEKYREYVKLYGSVGIHICVNLLLGSWLFFRLTVKISLDLKSLASFKVMDFLGILYVISALRSDYCRQSRYYCRRRYFVFILAK